MRKKGSIYRGPSSPPPATGQPYADMVPATGCRGTREDENVYALPRTESESSEIVRAAGSTSVPAVGPATALRAGRNVYRDAPYNRVCHVVRRLGSRSRCLRLQSHLRTLRDPFEVARRAAGRTVCLATLLKLNGQAGKAGAGSRRGGPVGGRQTVLIGEYALLCTQTCATLGMLAEQNS